MLNSLKGYALTTLAGAVGILLIVVGYKNRQLAKLQLDILNERYGTELDKAVKANYSGTKKAKAAFDKYLEVREKYQEKHGSIK